MIQQDILEQAKKVSAFRWEVLSDGEYRPIDDWMTEEGREHFADSISNEPDPSKRKQLVRETLDCGLAAFQDGLELARRVLLGD